MMATVFTLIEWTIRQRVVRGYVIQCAIAVLDAGTIIPKTGETYQDWNHPYKNDLKLCNASCIFVNPTCDSEIK